MKITPVTWEPMRVEWCSEKDEKAGVSLGDDSFVKADGCELIGEFGKGLA